MKRRNFLRYSFLFLTGCGVATSQSQSNSSNSISNLPDQLRFTVTDVNTLERLESEFGVFRQALAEVMGVKIKFVLVENFVAAAPAMLSNQLDIALAGPSEYIILNARAKAVPLIGITRPGYRTMICVKADSGITSLEQLKGKKIGMRTQGSSAAHLGATKMLMEIGFNPQSDFTAVMTKERGLQALNSGEIDAWADAPARRIRFLQAEGLSETDFPIIAQGQDLPNDIFVANPNFNTNTLNEIRNQILQKQDKLLQAMLVSPANKKYQQSTMIEANDVDYEVIREVYRAIGQDDFLR